MDGDVTIRSFNIELGHQGPGSITCNHAKDLINGNVLEGEKLGINAIVDTGTPRGR